ncbi:MAG: hypothetical protein ACJ746_20140 [Bryobacteraceae bacterium]
MFYTLLPSKHIGRIITCLTLLVWYRTPLIAQDHDAANGAKSPTLHVTHILGFEAVSRNANGDLSIQGEALRFQKSNNSAAQVPLRAIQNVSVGELDKQVGGVPLTLAKAAAPYGGGRVISLFSHKDYDTVTVEYLDADGGLHGAIFQLNKGQGPVLKSQLEAGGAQIAPVKDATTNQNTQENKNAVK